MSPAGAKHENDNTRSIETGQAQIHGLQIDCPTGAQSLNILKVIGISKKRSINEELNFRVVVKNEGFLTWGYPLVIHL